MIAFHGVESIIFVSQSHMHCAGSCVILGGMVINGMAHTCNRTRTQAGSTDQQEQSYL